MLLDTSGLLCLFHRGEECHAKAGEVFQAARGKLTHNYVLAEFVAAGGSPPAVPAVLFTLLGWLAGKPDHPRGVGG